MKAPAVKMIESFDGIEEASPDTVNKEQSADRPWALLSTFLILSTLLQSVKPSDAFVPFYIESRGIAKAIINSSVYPYRTYFMLAGLPIASYAGEYVCGYIPIIIFGLLCRWATQFIMYYGPGLISVQIAYAIFGLSHATKNLYSAFVYRLIPLHVFHRITGYVRAANLLAHVIGGTIGNLMLKGTIALFNDDGSQVSPYLLQFTMSQICVGLGVILFFVAMLVHHVQSRSGLVESHPAQYPPKLKSWSDVAKTFRSIYTTWDVIIWSTWWCVSFSIIELTWDYQSVLFLDMNTTVNETGNITAGARLCCAFASLASGRSRELLARRGYGIIAVGASLVGAGLIASAITQDIYVSYILFLAFSLINEFCLCSAMAQIAIRIPEAYRGIAILSNTILAMINQAIVQFVCGPAMIDVTIREKYTIMGCIMLTLSVVSFAAVSKMGSGRRPESTESTPVRTHASV